MKVSFGISVPKPYRFFGFSERQLAKVKKNKIRGAKNKIFLKSAFFKKPENVVHFLVHLQMIQFEVEGNPKPLKRHRSTRSGRCYDPSCADKKVWINKVRDMIPNEAFTGAIEVELHFYFSRPKSHFRTGRFSNELRQSAPTIHTKKPDIDNCIKFCLDAMNHHFYADDSQIISVIARKSYTDRHEGYTKVCLLPQI